MNKRPTIQTVAERAGVSRGTVDRVLNNRSYVRADVRERVLDAIRETGYLSPREAHRQTADRPQHYSPVKLGVHRKRPHQAVRPPRGNPCVHL